MKSNRAPDQQWGEEVRARNLRNAQRLPVHRRSSDRDPVKVARFVSFLAGACVASVVWAAVVFS